MTLFKRIFDFYLDSSIHVALSCLSLVLLTDHFFSIPTNFSVSIFAFSGTVTGYNFVKYDAITRFGKAPLKPKLRAIAIFSFLMFLVSIACFLKLRLITQLVAIFFLSIIVLYTLPFLPNKVNARNWAGIKIYIVALCWVGVTLVIPLVESGIALTSDFYLKCLQRFILLFTLILIFEIVDLKHDDIHLRTVPQQIGVKSTKILGVLLLLIFYILEFFRITINPNQLQINAVLVLIASLFLVYAKATRSRYYSAFWVELLPVLWFVLVWMLK